MKKNENKNANYYDLCIKLMDEYWNIRKQYPFGDKVIPLLFYHDFLSDVVNLRQYCFYLEGRYDKFKDRKDVFPDWEQHILDCKNSKEELMKSPVVIDSINSIKEFIKLGYLPSFSGYYKGQYLTFDLDENFGDYKINLSKFNVTDENSKQMYEYIKENLNTFIEEVRTY